MKNLTTLAITLGLLMCAGLACDKFKGTSSETPVVKSDNSKTSSVNTSSGNSNTNSSTSAPKSVEKADFTVTAEEFDAEFYKKGKDDLVKYAKKNIAVTGRVSTIVTEKKDTVQPWVTLYAPGVLHGVSCYFDDDNVDQLKKLTMDKNAKVQGFMDDFIVPKISPMLQHCVVLEGN